MQMPVIRSIYVDVQIQTEITTEHSVYITLCQFPNLQNHRKVAMDLSLSSEEQLVAMLMSRKYAVQ